MQVEATFPDLGSAPLELRMSRSSPGRYSLHDFAKNVYDVHAFGADGRELPADRGRIRTAGASTDHGGAVTVRLQDLRRPRRRHVSRHRHDSRTHQHAGGDHVGARTRRSPGHADASTRRPGAQWHVATQLHPGASPLEFTAPNLQYLMDSPVEFGPVAMREFTVGRPAFPLRRPSHRARDDELDGFVSDVEKIVREEGRDLRRVSRRTSRVTTLSSPITCRTRTATAWSIATAP